MWRIIVSLYRADLVTDYGEEEAGQMMTEGLRQYCTTCDVLGYDVLTVFIL
jgi:hypothetical protein